MKSLPIGMKSNTNSNSKPCTMLWYFKYHTINLLHCVTESQYCDVKMSEYCDVRMSEYCGYKVSENRGARVSA